MCRLTNVAALMDLTERYQGLVLELEHTLHTHQGLTTLQTQLNDELRVGCVENITSIINAQGFFRTSINIQPVVLYNSFLI